MTFLLLAQAATTAAPTTIFSNPVIPFACMAIIFYFLLIRPQQKKTKELQALVNSLKTGDKVVTNGGIHGIVSNIKDAGATTLTLKIADNVKIEIDKSAITTVNRAGTDATPSPAPAPALAGKN